MMRSGFHRLMRLVFALCCATVCAFTAAADTSYPQRPIRMVIPFPAGGSIDLVGRAIATNWSATLGQQIVIDNRSGAGGTVGAEIVARAAPDGLTLIVRGEIELALIHLILDETHAHLLGGLLAHGGSIGRQSMNRATIRSPRGLKIQSPA